MTFGIVSDQPGTFSVTAFFDANDNEQLDPGEEFEVSQKEFFQQANPPQCSDRVDNDGDGQTDFPGDPQCASSQDNDESQGGFQAPPSQCEDGEDNDGDGQTDFPDDAQCSSADDNDESQADFQAECNDGVDNDGDGQADFPADENCDGRNDDSEAAPNRDFHGRRARITRFRHIRLPGTRGRALLVRGRVRVNDGFNECRSEVPVKVQIRAGGEWITRKSDTTNVRGGFKVLIRHIHAKYRAVAPKFRITNQARNEIEVCRKAISRPKRHRRG